MYNVYYIIKMPYGKGSSRVFDFPSLACHARLGAQWYDTIPYNYQWPPKNNIHSNRTFSQRLLFLYNVPVVSHSLVYFNQRLLRWHRSCFCALEKSKAPTSSTTTKSHTTSTTTTPHTCLLNTCLLKVSGELWTSSVVILSFVGEEVYATISGRPTVSLPGTTPIQEQDNNINSWILWGGCACVAIKDCWGLLYTKLYLAVHAQWSSSSVAKPRSVWKVHLRCPISQKKKHHSLNITIAVFSLLWNYTKPTAMMMIVWWWIVNVYHRIRGQLNVQRDSR